MSLQLKISKSLVLVGSIGEASLFLDIIVAVGLPLSLQNAIDSLDKVGGLTYGRIVVDLLV